MALEVRSPLIRLANAFPGRQVYAKCEFLAPSGCFKIRGAEHLLDHLECVGGSRLLVVPSMGNTALGAATAARVRGFHVVGVVPTTIASAKDEKLRALGVELVKIAGGGSELLKHATEVARERNGYFVHPHLDASWTDGYQSIAAEILRELPTCRSLIIPLGGGGLLMGLTSYLEQHGQRVKVVGVEPFNYPKYAQFDHARTRTIADGLLLEHPHAMVQERIRARGVEVALVAEEAIRAALRTLYATQALVVEPSSAVPLAFVAAEGVLIDEPACVVLTGQNVSRADFDALVAAD